MYRYLKVWMTSKMTFSGFENEDDWKVEIHTVKYRCIKELGRIKVNGRDTLKD